MFLFLKKSTLVTIIRQLTMNDTFVYLVTLQNRVTSAHNNRDISLDVTVRQDVEKRLLSGTKTKRQQMKRYISSDKGHLVTSPSVVVGGWGIKWVVRGVFTR